MKYLVDLEVRKALDNHLLKLGRDESDIFNRVLDLSAFNIEPSNAHIYLTAGETGSMSNYPKDKTWLEYFLVKSPSRFITGTVEERVYQYCIWVKTDHNNGLSYNEVISSLLEDHFTNIRNPLHKDDKISLTVTRVYQNATILLDRKTDRFFNRVIMDCEVYVDTVEL